MTPLLRGAGAGDIPSLSELELRLFGQDAWSVRSLTDDLAGTTVAVLADDVVGYVVTRTVGQVADLLRIAVAPEHREAGLGALLLRGAMTDCADAGADRMLLEVAEDNTAALALYRAHGFVEIARRERYYRSGASALVLQRPLEGTAYPVRTRSHP